MVAPELGAFDDKHQFHPKVEIYANYELDWLTRNGCILETCEKAAEAERLMHSFNSLKESYGPVRASLGPI